MWKKALKYSQVYFNFIVFTVGFKYISLNIIYLNILNIGGKMAGEIEVFGFLFFVLIIIILFLVFFNKKWSATGNVLDRHEKIIAEAVNVQACVNKYKRELNRAREILALGIQIASSGMSNGAKGIPNYPQNQMNFTNIYSLLIEVLRTMRLSEDDLMYSIERFNTSLAIYNAYIQKPVFPQIAASSLQLEIQRGGSESFNLIHQQLDTAFIEVNELDKTVSQILGPGYSSPKEKEVPLLR